MIEPTNATTANSYVNDSLSSVSAKMLSDNWEKDVPYCIRERLWDWGYILESESVSVGFVVGAAHKMLEMIEQNDCYYADLLEVSPSEVANIKREVTVFLETYSIFVGVDL